MKKNEVFIIAEAGVNHNGDIALAYQLIDKAVDADCDAVKFQTFNPKKLVSKKTKMASYQEKNTGKNQTQQQMLEKLTFKKDDFIELKKYCDKKNIIFLSTPFDEESADLLYDLVPYYKIGSGDLTNHKLLEHIAKKNKPMILSTGMSYLKEVEKAIQVIKQVNNKIELFLLHCTTNYPCPIEEVNLKAMITLKDAFKLPVGYSDHTEGIEIPIAATALGANIIEKHFTLDKTMEGPDHKTSLEPEELKEMVKKIRNIEKALGDGIKQPNESEKEIMQFARKVLVINKNMKAGSLITKSNIEIKRAGKGINPEFIDIIVGKKLIKDIDEDEAIQWKHLMR